MADYHRTRGHNTKNDPTMNQQQTTSKRTRLPDLTFDYLNPTTSQPTVADPRAPASTSSTPFRPSLVELHISNQRLLNHLRLTDRQIYDKYMQGVSANNTKTFTLFPNLSSELRLKIWGFCAPEPALITPVPSTRGRAHAKWSYPAVLQTCKESRYEFLARVGVTRDHGMYQSCRVVHMSGVKMFYMRMETDHLYLNSKMISLIRNAQFSALQHLVIPHNRLAGTYGHELRISLLCFRSLKSITVLVSHDTWFTLGTIPGSYFRSDRGCRINGKRLQDIKDGVDQMVQGIMRTSTIWNAIGAPKVELLCGEWPGDGKMVFPEGEEDEKWRPKEVKDALAAYEAKRLAGTLSGLKMPAHMARYLSEAEYEPDFIIRGSHGGRHNGQSSSGVVNSKGPQALQSSEKARSADLEQDNSVTPFRSTRLVPNYNIRHFMKSLP